MKTKDQIAIERYGNIYYYEKTKYNDLCSMRKTTVDRLFKLQEREKLN